MKTVSKILVLVLALGLSGCLESGETTDPSLAPRYSAPCERCGVEWATWAVIENTNTTLSSTSDILQYQGQSDSVLKLQSNLRGGASDYVDYLELTFTPSSQVSGSIVYEFSAGNSIELAISRQGNNIVYSIIKTLDGVVQPATVNGQVLGSVATNNYVLMIIFSQTSGVIRASVDYNLTDMTDAQYVNKNFVNNLTVLGSGLLSARTF